MANIIRLVDYIVADEDYQNPALKSIIGEANGDSTAISTLDPEPVESGVPFLSLQEGDNPLPPPAPAIIPIDQDQGIHAFAYNGTVRLLMSDTRTPVSWLPSEDTRYSLLAEPRNPESFLSVLSRDIALTVGGETETVAEIAINPHGTAQLGDTLLFGWYDDGTIYFLGTNELNGLPAGSTYKLRKTPIDLHDLAYPALPANAHLQSMFYAPDPDGNPVLFALFITYDVDDESHLITDYYSSILLRLAVTVDTQGDISLTQTGKVETSPNSQDLFMAPGSNGAILLIQAIGGKQQDGGTNGVLSSIRGVPAFGTWDNLGGQATIMLTGDPAPPPETAPTAYDIQDGAAVYREGVAPEDIKVIISTGMYHDGYEQYDKQVYYITAAALTALQDVTISDAADFGLTAFKGAETGMGGGVRDMFIEPGDSAAADRLWERDGGQLSVCSVANPESDKQVYTPGTGPQNTGGAYLNSATCTSLALEEARLGRTIKRTLRGGALPQAQAQEAGEEEEEEEE